MTTGRTEIMRPPIPIKPEKDVTVGASLPFWVPKCSSSVDGLRVPEAVTSQ